MRFGNYFWVPVCSPRQPDAACAGPAMLQFVGCCSPGFAVCLGQSQGTELTTRQCCLPASASSALSCPPWPSVSSRPSASCRQCLCWPSAAAVCGPWPAWLYLASEAGSANEAWSGVECHANLCCQPRCNVRIGQVRQRLAGSEVVTHTGVLWVFPGDSRSQEQQSCLTQQHCAV